MVSLSGDESSEVKAKYRILTARGGLLDLSLFSGCNLTTVEYKEHSQVQRVWRI